MGMKIVSAGPLTTVQDRGRTGCAAGGFQESGCCDKYAMELANLLAGNLDNAGEAAVLECTLRGPSLIFDAPTIFALTGADMGAVLSDRPVPRFAPLYAEAGDLLTLGFAKDGLRGYFAVYGGIDVPPVMGSRSTNVKCRIGGYEGRALRDGDALAVAPGAVEPPAYWEWLQERRGGLPDFSAYGGWYAHATRPWRFVDGRACPLFRVVPGPQEDAFTPAGQNTFTRSLYTVTTDANRMACKLNGPAIETVNGSDILSDGIVEGSVQVSSNGQPIVMMADHQTTGGYAKIGTVISTDIPAMAQVRPGEQVSFCFVSPEEAIDLYRKEVRKLVDIKERIRP